ncbi:MAG: multidrug effflux MFS transporter [Bifidobacteriaceae bacterium]|nr:multidrug effflux MFS transporter [Bifidobacteriaceae bacterium]
MPRAIIPRPTPGIPSSQAGLVVLLGSMAALGAVTGDIYLPSLPDIAADFSASDGAAQATVSLTLLGGAVGQLVMGPISDVVGRRTPVLAGLVLHVAASIGIVLTPSLGLLLALRFVQGVGNAAAAVVALAVIRDLFTGARAARLISQLMLVIGVGPMLAPTVGSLIAHAAGWRGVFVLLAACGAGLAVFVYVKLPDTLRPDDRGTRSVGALVRGYRVLFGDARFIFLALLPGLGSSALMAWVVASPFLIMGTYALPDAVFPVVFAAGGVFMVGGAQLNAALVRRVGPRRLLAAVLPLTLVCALALTLLSASHTGGLAGLLIPMFAVLLASGMGPANASALAMSRHGEVAGSAAALIGTLQAGTAAGMTALVGTVGGGQLGMATVIAGALALAMLIALTGAGVYRRQDPRQLP